jgi:hypothetical protein
MAVGSMVQCCTLYVIGKDFLMSITITEVRNAHHYRQTMLV